jgi:hypothetical protein
VTLMNLHDDVIVRLTDAGERRLEEHVRATFTGSISAVSPPEGGSADVTIKVTRDLLAPPLDNGRRKFTLREFIEVFGPVMADGTQFIEDDNLELEIG